MRNNFESLLVRSLRAYFNAAGIDAFVERRPNTRYKTQYVDIIIDSPSVGYRAIECKSIGGDHLYFNSNFHDSMSGVHQVETIDYYIKKTGRKGYLAVELRQYGHGGNRCYFIPWHVVKSRYLEGSKGFTADEIRGYPCAKKADGLYDIAGTIAYSRGTK